MTISYKKEREVRVAVLAGQDFRALIPPPDLQSPVFSFQSAESRIFIARHSRDFSLPLWSHDWSWHALPWLASCSGRAVIATNMSAVVARVESSSTASVIDWGFQDRVAHVHHLSATGQMNEATGLTTRLPRFT